MSTIKEFTALLKNGAAELPPITRKPTNDNLKRLREVLRNLLQAVELPVELIPIDSSPLKQNIG